MPVLFHPSGGAIVMGARMLCLQARHFCEGSFRRSYMGGT